MRRAAGTVLAAALATALPGASAAAPAASEWWRDAVFYEVYVRSFQDSDGDGIGDFRGLTARLDYLNDGDPATATDLGVTALWLMPVCESPSVHGYDVVDYLGLEKDYGTRADFEEFLRQARARGIRVIVDLVLNHVSRQHPWFLEAASDTASPRRRWFRWAPQDAGTRWHPAGGGGSYYYGYFGAAMPDLDFAHPGVREAMHAVAAWWLDTLEVDGFRVDAVKHLFETGTADANAPATFDYLVDFRKAYKGRNPAALAIGEAWDRSATAARYAQGDRLDMVFEFDLRDALIKAVQEGQPALLLAKLEELGRLHPSWQFGSFLGNHDLGRTATVLGDPGRARLAVSLLLALPGVPFLYYGDEIGALGATTSAARRPMAWDGGETAGFTGGLPWQPVMARPAGHDVKSLQADPRSLWHHHRRLVKARLENAALARGAFRPLQASRPSVLAFQRGTGPGAVVVVANLDSAEAADVALAGTATGLPSGAAGAVGQLSGAATRGPAVGPDGTFQGWKPAPLLAGRTVHLYRIGGSLGIADRRAARATAGKEKGKPAGHVSPLGRRLPARPEARGAVRLRPPR